MARNQTLLKPYEKARPKQKKNHEGKKYFGLGRLSWLASIPKDFATSHPKPRVGKLKGDKFGKERFDFDFLQRK